MTKTKTKTKTKLRSRFKTSLDARALDYSSSLSVDKVIALHDVRGSKAHVKMLGKQKIVPSAVCKKILKGLAAIETEIIHDSFYFDPLFEDVHMLIESRLTKLVGEAGEHLHTARSRNDQTATATRLWLRECLDYTRADVASLIDTLLTLAEGEEKTPLPGMTHLQFAQPISLAHLLLAWAEMSFRDLERIRDVRARVNIMPLGSGAMAGVGYPIDRTYTAELLGFDKPSENSLDAVSDRDFAIEAVQVAAMGMMHLSRICEDIILYSSIPFQFLKVDDTFATGSSMMPQKKNPDIAELIRGNSSIVTGNWVALITLMKAQSLTYNRDNQHDKTPLFQAFTIWNSSLSVLTPMLSTIHFNRERMRTACNQGALNATDVADYLCAKGMPFRSAYTLTATLVSECEKRIATLDTLPLDIYQKHSALFASDIYRRISVDGMIEARSSYGGTASKQVKQAIRRAHRRLEKLR